MYSFPSKRQKRKLSKVRNKIAAKSGDEMAIGVALMMLLFPFFFLIGLVTLLIGVFKKESANKSI
ncbi:hypothetical protein PMEGAPR236_36970 [Priestia megaterium]